MPVVSETTTIFGVAALLLGMLMLNQVLGKTVRKAEPETDNSSMLCKFVVHEGSVIGETVAEEGESLIIKQAGVFSAIPTKQVQPDGAELRLTGSLDWDAAREQGAQWYESVKGEGQDEVAGQMTRSEDVKVPAREAFDARHNDSEPTDGEEE